MNKVTKVCVSHYLNERETFDFAGLKFQEHLNVFVGTYSLYKEKIGFENFYK